MSIAENRLFAALSNSTSVLIAGAGGGYDVFCGLPLYFYLKQTGTQVRLANLSFAEIGSLPGPRLAPSVIEVTAKTAKSSPTFPERSLASWFFSRGEEVGVYCFEKTGVRPLVESYRSLVERHNIDAIVLFDGGADALLRGDEAELGSPSEDATSVVAVNEIDVPTKLLVCLGFGTDSRHGVCHAHVLRAISELSRSGGFLGAFSLDPSARETKLYCQATEAVFRDTGRPSYVNAAIIDALRGKFGESCSDTTNGLENPPWINPLLTFYWAFSVAAVSDRMLYSEYLKDTELAFQVSSIIEGFRKGLVTIRNREPIPI